MAAESQSTNRDDRDKKSGGGNTESPSARQQLQAVYWSFTFNNYEIEQIEMIEQILRHECKWYVFQEETGEQGTKHLQGTLCLIQRKRMTQLKKLIDERIHWEMTKSVKASVIYCTKAETRSGKIFAFGFDIPEPLKLIDPKGWQIDIVNLVQGEPDDRHIHWFWDKDGCIGKTQLAKYLVARHNAYYIGGKASDIYFAISRAKYKKIVILDIARSEIDDVPYAALECVKNGIFFSGKYESQQCIFNSPWILCFANYTPDISKMSKDRWVITRLSEIKEIAENCPRAAAECG